ncbi:MAG: hypothetical protein HKN92_10410, partial [Chitinophagales bacterium]|nr:hypothetical protein [Chitinophagales bacterium]
EKEVAARTYADTAHIYLAPGEWDIEVKPLEQSDVKATTLTNVLSGDPENSHRTISFDAGKLKVVTENNGEGWDAVVNIYEAGTKTKAAGGRTYGKDDVYDLNPGKYDIELAAMKIEGNDIKYKESNVEVKANEVIEVKHNFKSGIALIGASSSSGLVDCVVKIQDVKSKTTVASGRTYTQKSNNPDTYILNPGKYEVKLTALGDHKGKEETFTMEVQEGKTIEKMITF